MLELTESIGFRFGSFVLDLERGFLFAADGQERSLRPKSFTLLQVLLENAGRLMSREAIMEVVWPDIFVTDDNITQCVRDIRRALEPEAHLILRTAPRRGYVVVADVARLRKDARNTPGDQWDISCFANRVFAARGALAPPREAVALPPPRPAPKDKLPRFSVLVANLVSMGGGAADIETAHGISGDIRTDLSRLPGYVISGISETGSQPDNPAGWRETARINGVNFLVQGSLQCNREWIGVNVQLVDVQTGGFLWANRFTATCDGEARINGEITARLVRALQFALIGTASQRIEALPEAELTADDLVVLGKAMLVRPISEANRQTALGYYEQALERDSGCTRARVGIAYVLVANMADGWSRATERDGVRAEQLLTEIIRLAADRPMPHMLMGILYRLGGRLHDSKVELEIALALAPGQPMALSLLALTLIFMGQAAEAIPLLEKSFRSAPNDSGTPFTCHNFALAHLLLGDVESAITWARRGRAGNPQLFYNDLVLAMALGLQGERQEARVTWQRTVRLRPDIASRCGMRALLRQASDRFLAWYEIMIVPGLLSAGMTDK